MLRTEDKRSTTGDTFLCAAAAEAWSHDSFVSKHNRNKKTNIFIVVSSLISSAQELDHHTLACLGSSIICVLEKGENKRACLLNSISSNIHEISHKIGAVGLI